MAPLHILFGAGFTVATAVALGLILLRALALPLYRIEERLLAFVTGSALLSAIVFALCSLKLARKGVFLAVGILAIGTALWTGRGRGRVLPAQRRFPPLARKWKWIMVAIFGAFTVIYFFNAMAPEMSPDGSAYHLRLVRDYYRAHGFVRITTNMYASLSEGIELLFLFAYGFGKYSAASLVHFSFLAALPFLMLSYARRFGFPVAGLAAGLLVYASPVVGIDGNSAYIDVALATAVFALFYFLQIWDAERDNRLLVPVGILAGFCISAKYTAFLAVPYAVGFVVWKLWRAHKPMLRPAAVVASLAVLMFAPWLLKNWLWMHDPVAPFANLWFPNHYVHISFERSYRSFLATYGLPSYRQIPYELTLNGVLGGIFGPVFLLMPLGLLALRWRAGLQILLAGAVFAATYFSNIGTRFLIPAAPFLALAFVLVLNWEWLIFTVLMAHAVLSWPAVLDLYAPLTWHDNRIPVAAALRIDPEDSYLNRNFPDYSIDRMIESAVPAGDKVFSFDAMAETYTKRQILVSYQSASNEILSDILRTPLIPDMQANRIVDFRFPSRPLRKLRLVQTAGTKDAIWSVTELRVYNGGKELPRSPRWRLTAKPNPWDVQLAFDNSPVTRWRSWQAAKPGMYIEIDFGSLQPADAVRAEMSSDSYAPRVNLEGMDDSGKWSQIPGVSSDREEPVRNNLRYAATCEVAARGIHWVLIRNGDFGAQDYLEHAALWKWKLVGQRQDAKLYNLP